MQLNRAVVAVVCGITIAGARSILDFPLEVRQQNVLRISRQSCDECITLDELYAANAFCFVLFYERALMGQHKYKTAVIRGFHEACAELRWSHVVCGAVDMVEDKEYALRYIDPSTAPAHILVRDGQPVAMQKRHLTQLMQKPGDKETILWHLGDLLAAGASYHSLAISAEVEEPEAMSVVFEQHEVVLVVASVQGSRSGRAFRAAAQRLVLRGELPAQVEAPGTNTPRRGKGHVPRPRKRMFITVATKEKVLAAANVTKGTVTAFIDGKRHRVHKEFQTDCSEEDAAALLRSVALPALQQTGAVTPQGSAGKEGATRKEGGLAGPGAGDAAQEAGAATSAFPSAPPTKGKRSGKGAPKASGKGSARTREL